MGPIPPRTPPSDGPPDPPSAPASGRPFGRFEPDLLSHATARQAMAIHTRHPTMNEGVKASAPRRRAPAAECRPGLQRIAQSETRGVDDRPVVRLTERIRESYSR